MEKKKSVQRPAKGKPDSERRLRQADRLARILKVLQLIQSRGRWDAKALSQEIECSERTVYRDLAVLELAGVPWTYEKESCSYRVRPDYQFPVLNLTDDELIGQATATAATNATGLDVNFGAKAASSKLAAKASNKSEQILLEAQRFTEVLDLKLADHSRHRDFIRTVQWALIQRKQVTGQYVSPYEPKPVRVTLHPFRLCLVKSAWYLIGCSTEDMQVRTYRIVRFKTLRMRNDSASIPDDFNLKAYFGNAWSVYRGDKSFQVELRFDKEVADVVTETNWHATQKVLRHTDGGVTLQFTVDGLNEIMRWVLGWAGRVKVIKPVELREQLLVQHQKAIRMNEEVQQ